MKILDTLVLIDKWNDFGRLSIVQDVKYLHSKLGMSASLSPLLAYL